jgi:hypothetical protein
MYSGRSIKKKGEENKINKKSYTMDKAKKTKELQLTSCSQRRVGQQKKNTDTRPPYANVFAFVFLLLKIS